MREARPPTAAGCSFRSPRSSGVRSGFIARTFKAPNMVPSSQPRTPAALPSDSCLTPPLTPSPTSGPQTDSPTSQGGAQRRDGQVRCGQMRGRERTPGRGRRAAMARLVSPPASPTPPVPNLGVPRVNHTDGTRQWPASRQPHLLPTFPVPTRWRRSQRAHNLRFFGQGPDQATVKAPIERKAMHVKAPIKRKGMDFHSVAFTRLWCR